MRILLESTSEVGKRTAYVLLAEDDVDFVGVWNSPGTRRSPRTGTASDVDGYDIAVTDRSRANHDLIARCSVAGIPIVLWADDADVAPGSATVPIVTGANVGSALIAALLAHPNATPAPGEPVTVAWTEPGKPHKRGEDVVFPEPVGAMRAKRRAPGQLVATRDDEWAGAVVRVGSEDAIRVVGVADHAAHLEALVLAAATLVAAAGVYEPGARSAAEAGEQLLNMLRKVELDFATWRSHS